VKLKKTNKEIDTTRVIINVPTKLLKSFDEICESQSYQRSEGIKEAMRSFINVEKENSDTFLSEKSDKQMQEMLKLIEEMKKTKKTSEFYKKMK